jgi:hypothetical protein
VNHGRKPCWPNHDYYDRGDTWIARHSLGEDSRGNLSVPPRGRTVRWPDRLNLRNPRHWLPWLITRCTGRVVYLEDS